MLDTQQRQDVVYFVGEEVEHTICHGMRTLFVVGHPPVAEIHAKAMEHDCRHIYFGTSQSYNPTNENDTAKWNASIIPLLDTNFWVTLDFDVSYVEHVKGCGYNAYERFVPMISIKVPNIRDLNYNTTVKIDDTTWGATNPGVWSMPLYELMKREYFTHWDQYTGDTNVDDDDKHGE